MVSQTSFAQDYDLKVDHRFAKRAAGKQIEMDHVTVIDNTT
jgi:hypothetical protein